MRLMKWIKALSLTLLIILITTITIQVLHIFNTSTSVSSLKRSRLDRLFVNVEEMVGNYYESSQQTSSRAKQLLNLAANLTRINLAANQTIKIHSLNHARLSGLNLTKYNDLNGSRVNVLRDTRQDSQNDGRIRLNKQTVKYKDSGYHHVNNITHGDDNGNGIVLETVERPDHIRDEDPFLMKFNSYDHHTLISPPPEACRKHCLGFIVFVHSQPENRDRRDSIRRTWGSHSLIYGTKVIFVLGKTENRKWNIAAEAEIYEDILQQSFTDTYDNSVWKSISSLLYIELNCSQSIKYVVKASDDVLVNMKRLNDLMLRFRNEKKVILGAISKNNIVQRNGNHRVSMDQYPQTEFPNHLNGDLYVLSIDVVHRFTDLYELVPVIPLENVYVTGLLATQAKIQLTEVKNLLPGGSSYGYKSECEFIRGRLVGLGGNSVGKVRIIWDKLLTGAIC